MAPPKCPQCLTCEDAMFPTLWIWRQETGPGVIGGTVNSLRAGRELSSFSGQASTEITYTCDDCGYTCDQDAYEALER